MKCPLCSNNMVREFKGKNKLFCKFCSDNEFKVRDNLDRKKEDYPFAIAGKNIISYKDTFYCIDDKLYANTREVFKKSYPEVEDENIDSFIFQRINMKQEFEGNKWKISPFVSNKTFVFIPENSLKNINNKKEFIDFVSKNQLYILYKAK